MTDFSKKNWNDRFVSGHIAPEEVKKLPKVPRYRRRNGEEVRGTLFTGPKKPLDLSKQVAQKCHNLTQKCHNLTQNLPPEVQSPSQ